MSMPRSIAAATELEPARPAWPRVGRERWGRNGDAAEIPGGPDDLRRLLDARVDIHTTRVAEVMTTGCKTSQAGELAVEALNLMENYKISALLVVNEHKQPIGAFNMHMLLKAGVI